MSHCSTGVMVVKGCSARLQSRADFVDLFAQDLRFVTTEERKRTCRREREVVIQTPKERGIIESYRVVDNVLHLTDDEWSRIVAVFVQVVPVSCFPG